MSSIMMDQISMAVQGSFINLASTISDRLGMSNRHQMEISLMRSLLAGSTFLTPKKFHFRATHLPKATLFQLQAPSIWNKFKVHRCLGQILAYQRLLVLRIAL